MATRSRGDFPIRSAWVTPGALRKDVRPGDTDQAWKTIAEDWFFNAASAATLTGTGEGSLASPTGSASGAVAHTGAATGEIAQATASASGLIAHVGAASATLEAATAEAAGTASGPAQTVEGTGEGTLAALTGEGIERADNVRGSAAYTPSKQDDRIALIKGRGAGRFPAPVASARGEVEMPLEFVAFLEAA